MFTLPTSPLLSMRLAVLMVFVSDKNSLANLSELIGCCLSVGA
jgi:hypothetical protein